MQATEYSAYIHFAVR